MLSPLIVAAIFLAKIESPTGEFVEKKEVQIGTNQIITTTDIALTMETLRPRYKNLSEKDLWNLATKIRTERALKKNALSDMGAGVDQEVKARMNRIQAAYPNPADYKKFFADQGMSPEEFENRLTEELEQQQFESYLRRNITTPKEKELEEYFKNNKAKFQYAPKLEIVECIIPWGNNPEQAEKEALSYIEKPKNSKKKEKPKDFQTCVKKISVGATKKDKGKLGTFTYGMLNPAYEAKLFEMKAGQIATFRIPQGLQLLKISKLTKTGPLSFEQVKNRVQADLEKELLAKEEERTLRRLRDSTFVKVFSKK